MTTLERAPASDSEEEVAVVPAVKRVVRTDYAETELAVKGVYEAGFKKYASDVGKNLNGMYTARKELMDANCLKEGVFTNVMETGDNLLADPEFVLGLEAMTDVSSVILNCLVYGKKPFIEGQYDLTKALQKVCSKFSVR